MDKVIMSLALLTFAALIVGLLFLVHLGTTQGAEMRYHVLVMGQTYHCNEFVMDGRLAKLSGCLNDRSYTIYNPVNVVVRESN